MDNSIKDAVAYLQHYMQTYSDQKFYETYQTKTYIDDVLYGLGVSLNKNEYEGVSGYDRFKERLRVMLDTEK